MKIKLTMLVIFTIFLTSCGKSGPLRLPPDPQQKEENTNQDNAK